MTQNKTKVQPVNERTTVGTVLSFGASLSSSSSHGDTWSQALGITFQNTSYPLVSFSNIIQNYYHFLNALFVPKSIQNGGKIKLDALLKLPTQDTNSAVTRFIHLQPPSNWRIKVCVFSVQLCLAGNVKAQTSIKLNSVCYLLPTRSQPHTKGRVSHRLWGTHKWLWQKQQYLMPVECDWVPWILM